MEYCSGGRLQEYIDRNGPLTAPDGGIDMAKALTKQILAAVKYLHSSLNIVHRDLKPDNILLQPSNTRGVNGCLGGVPCIKIADFGLSTFFESTRIMKEQCGTPAYTAPEVQCGAGYSRAVDLWAVGVMLYYMLSLRMPFHITKADRRHLREKTATLEEVYPSSLDFGGIPCPVVQDLIRRLLRLEPLERYSAVEAAQHEWITGVRGEHRPSVMEMLRDHDYSLLEPPDLALVDEVV